MKAFVTITQLQKKIDDFHLGPIDLEIESGTITALVGNNGSGKSTLLKLMMHLAKLDMGDIRLFDKPVHGEDESWKTNVAYQPQTTIGYDPFTGEALKELISRWYPDWDDTLFNKIVSQLDVPLKKPFGKLSQGSKQKLVLALTIPRNAQLLILDEPTSFIDIPSKRILMDILVDWMDQGERAIIIASHQAEDIQKLADYIVVLQNGKLIGKYTKDELTENYWRYWMEEGSLLGDIPGVIVQEKNVIISNQPKETENFLDTHNIKWSDQIALTLEETITVLLDRKDG